MNKNLSTKIGIGVVALIILALGVTFPRGNPVVQQVLQAGSVASPDIQSPYFSFGLVRQWAAQTQSLNQASTTLCSLVSPPATSTLDFASLHMNVATTGGATTITFARANFGTVASTTPILASNTSIGSGAEANSIATTTLIFSPNQQLNITQAGGGSFTGQTFSEVGVCQARWTQISY